MGIAVSAALVAACVTSGCAQDASPVAQVLDEFRAIDWDSRAKMAKPDPADEAWRVRVKAEHVLIGMGVDAVPDLISALADEDRHVRGLAAQCLGPLEMPRPSLP